MIKIESYSKKKKDNKQGGGVGNNTVVNSSTTLSPHFIYGNLYDGTQDVKGDIKDVKNITASESVSCDKIAANTGNIGELTANTITSHSVNSQEVTSDSINAKNATTDIITSKKGVFNDITSDFVIATEAEVKSLTTNVLSGNDASFNNINVSGTAHFFQLMIDQIKSSRGQTIVTAANAKIFKVEKVNEDYKCYFHASDEVSKIGNMFAVNDLVVMQTFNAAYDSNYNVNNRYYWRKVINVSNTPIEDDGKYYHWITLSNSDCDINSNSIPQSEDEICQLGNTTDSTRQSAIIISAYNSQFLDSDLLAPSISQYEGINRYELKPFRLNVLSKKLNSFIGNFKVQGGKSLEEVLKEKNENEPPYIGGNGHWMIWDKVNKVYKDSGVNATGEKGEDGDLIKLTISFTKNIYDLDGNLNIVTNGYVKRYSKGNVSTPTDAAGYNVELSVNGTNIPILKSNINNLGLWKFRQNIKNDDKSNMPASVTIKLMKGYSTIDTLVVPITFNHNALIEVTDSVKIMAQGNQQKINELTGKIESNSNSIASINVKNDQIESKVKQINVNISDNYVTNTNLQSIIKQQANQITLAIINQVNGNLKKVGIDIDMNEINLIANKTNFVDENGKKFITVSKDENGIPHFIFLDDNEKAKYDLGYTGLRELVSDYKSAYWTKMKLVNITGKSLISIYPKTAKGTDYFRYNAPRHHITGALGSHAEDDGKVFDAEMFRNQIPDGYYTDENMNKIYNDMTPIDFNEDTKIYGIAVSHFVNGRIDHENSGMVLIKIKNNNLVGYCDEQGKSIIVQGGLVQNYPFVK